MRALIADDFNEITDSLEKILCDHFDCIVVTSLKDVLHKLEKCTFDLCILDLVYEGEGVLDIYGVVQRFPDTKFVVISAYLNQVDIKRLLDTERVQILKKPFSINQLLNAIKSVLPECSMEKH